MFTGIVEGLGEVVGLRPQPGGARLWLRPPQGWPRLTLGSSVAVDGACLTVAAWEGDAFVADLSTETLDRTTLGSRAAGDRVNLERPLTLGTTLGGHLVTGHVDGVGTVTSVQPDGDGAVMRLRTPRDLAPLLVFKGSVSVDGVSLTVADLTEDEFVVALIPHTLRVTTLGTRRVGNAVNLEMDLLGKYVARLLTRLDRLPAHLLAPPEAEGAR
jgi:riboflavin synthase